MKQIKHLLGMAAMLLFAASCSSDEPVDPVNPVVDHDQTRYIAVSLNNSSATRADYQEGTDAENEIEKLLFLFFSATGEPTAAPVPINDIPTSTPSTGNVEEIVKTVVQVDIKKNEAVPAYVVCLVNPGVTDHELDGLNMDAVRRQTILSAQTTDTHKFKMINSVYYGYDAVKGQADQLIFGTPIEFDNLYTTSEAASNALTAGNGTKIYVERYAAKVQVTVDLTDNTKTINYAVDGYDLEFVPVAWSVNANEHNAYRSKRFTDNADDATPTKDAVDSKLGANWWNNETDRRSFWSCTPAYHTHKYPQVSDDLRDKNIAAGASSEDFSLVYYSYKQICENGRAVDDTDNWLYFMETTASKEAFTSDNPKAAVPSVLLVGKYKLNPKDGGDAIENRTFYLYGRNVNGLYNVYFDEGTNTIKKKMMGLQKILFANEGGTNPLAEDNAYVSVMHPTKATRDAFAVAPKVPARMVTLQVNMNADQLADATREPIYFRDGFEADGTSPKFTAITDQETMNRANTLLIKALSYAQTYVNGDAYFSIPIKHLGAWRNGTNPNGTLNPSDAEFKWDDVRAGDYGLVRNHVYQININGIKGLATGIHGENNPIVPPIDEQTYYIAYSLNILSWAVVPPQNVEL